jgi:two-component system, LytTR family, sensor histidine kinase AlgZ
MHPILNPIRRFLLYLAAWIPLIALLAYLMDKTAGLLPLEAIALSIPLCLFYACVCLSAWYPCRATPFDRTPIAQFILTHAAGAVFASVVWIAAAKVLGRVIASTGMSPGLDARIAHTIPLLMGTGVLLYLLCVNFYYALLAVQASQEADRRVMQASVLAREAELRALKAQVNPHFLFNSLNSISALAGSDPAKAREMCILLGDFLRRTLGLGEKTSISLDEEMSLIRAFLAVEKIRFGARVRLEENIDKDALALQVPPLLLQPLVENAVVHGIANLIEGGQIKLDAHCRNGEISIVVENPFDPDAPRRRRNGVGLANVRQRLTARYGEHSRFEVTQQGESFRVAIALPAQREEQAS